jgi:hypothetical protein
MFMSVSEQSEYDLTLLPAERWTNLRAILMRRKGLAPGD